MLWLFFYVWWFSFFCRDHDWTQQWDFASFPKVFVPRCNCCLTWGIHSEGSLLHNCYTLSGDKRNMDIKILLNLLKCHPLSPRSQIQKQMFCNIISWQETRWEESWKSYITSEMENAGLSNYWLMMCFDNTRSIWETSKKIKKHGVNNYVY